MVAPRKRMQASASSANRNTSRSEQGTEEEGAKKTLHRPAFKTISYIIVAFPFVVAACYSMLQNDSSSSSSMASLSFYSTVKQSSSARGSGRGPRFVSVVIPSVVDSPHRHRRVQAIVETWAEASNALIVVHNATQEYPMVPASTTWDGTKQLQPADKTKYPQVLQLPTNITMADDDGFTRLEFILRHVYQEQQADFIFLVNDHSYVVPQHLCRYLQDKSSDRDLYAGRAMKNPGVIFNSGAAGYLMSRHTIKRLLDVWNEGKDCQADKSWLRSNPDLVVAQCLQDVLKVPALDTREANKYHRFHSYGLVRTVLAAVDEWYVNVHNRFENTEGFDESYRILLNGTDCCSAETISFHYVEYMETRALHTIRQRLLQEDIAMTDEQLLAYLIETWPKQELGGYSFYLPIDKPEEMKHIVSVLRKMSSTDLEATCF
jgi:hypothetical protein